ncbi:unnamed protein product [Nezara viridula]|uniref:Uncharacterized protein n=1 Tax=Nezara viridula TaxID=85310 RepID=A0A9P0E9S2_NEZVI|nr:unnamed protein product [Nezara viridula]
MADILGSPKYYIYRGFEAFKIVRKMDYFLGEPLQQEIFESIIRSIKIMLNKEHPRARIEPNAEMMDKEFQREAESSELIDSPRLRGSENESRSNCRYEAVDLDEPPGKSLTPLPSWYWSPWDDGIRSSYYDHASKLSSEQNRRFTFQHKRSQ